MKKAKQVIYDLSYLFYGGAAGLGAFTITQAHSLSMWLGVFVAALTGVGCGAIFAQHALMMGASR